MQRNTLFAHVRASACVCECVCMCVCADTRARVCVCVAFIHLDAEYSKFVVSSSPLLTNNTFSKIVVQNCSVNLPYFLLPRGFDY